MKPENLFLVLQSERIKKFEVRKIKNGLLYYLKKRGISPDQLVIAPSDLINQSESVK